MAGENEEIYHRLAAAEKEIYHMSRQMSNLESEKPIQRISMMELSVKQIAADLISMEKISGEMSEKLSRGIDELKTQAAVSAARLGWIVGSGVFAGGVMAAWPVLKELMKAMIA